MRVATAADAEEVARLHVRSWQSAYRGLLPAEYLDGLRWRDRAERYQFDVVGPDQPMTVVALDGGAIRGFATTGPARDADAEGSGELIAIYVDPDRWGAGIGRLLIADARERLHTRGFVEAIVWVLAGNRRAERFYRIDGWAPDGSGRGEDHWGVAADEVRYRRPLP